MSGLPLMSRAGSLVCPLCEAGKLRPADRDAVRCGACGGRLRGEMLETLRRIPDLPDALGRHPCECGHPEMRRLPDGTFHCPGCGSEVLPLDAAATPEDPGEAYRTGWVDGRFGEGGSFVGNPNLARWAEPSERLGYYRGHRAGSKARRTSAGPEPGRRDEFLERGAR